MAGDISIGITKQKLRSSKRPLPEEEDPDDPFSGECGCLGGKGYQIFWYRPMGSPDFGIHMDASEFEKCYPGKDMETKKPYFIHGICHEYFHHITDSWCVRADISRIPLMEHYSKEINKLKPIFILEESMAEEFASTYSDLRFDRGGGAYSLDKPFAEVRNWCKGSIIVAHQYIEGKYNIDELTPEDGFTKSNIDSLELNAKWGQEVPINSNFSIEQGFSKEIVSGVWTLLNIPFHIHRPKGQNWSKEREEFFLTRYSTTNESRINFNR